jgi:chromosome partitioning protein
MATHAILGRAGGSAKTTTTVTLGALLAESGAKVLLWDNDAQSTATLWSGLTSVLAQSTAAVIAAVLSGVETVTLDDVIRPSPTCPGLFVAGGHDKLTQVQRQASFSEEDGKTCIRTAIEGLEQHFDAILIDCAGSDDTLTLAAVIAATGTVIATTLPGAKEVKSVQNAEELIATANKGFGKSLTLGAVVPCRVTSRAISRELLEKLSADYPNAVTPPVRDAAAPAEAGKAGVPLPQFAPKSPATSDYRAVLKSLIDRGLLP